LALESAETPSVIALTRQGLAQVRTDYKADNLCSRGAYEVSAASSDAAVTLLATGSEVAIALDAQKTLEADGIATKVVSVPSFELFAQQDDDYRAGILGNGVRIGIEAGVRQGWESLIGDKGGFVGMDSFGASAPINDLYNHFGITAERVVEEAKARL
jgi:transketolase